MNSTYKLEEIAQCGGGPAGESSSPSYPNPPCLGAVPISLILLSVLLALLAVFVAIGIVLLIHRMFLRFCDEEGRSRRYHKQVRISRNAPVIPPLPGGFLISHLQRLPCPSLVLEKI